MILFLDDSEQRHIKFKKKYPNNVHVYTVSELIKELESKDMSDDICILLNEQFGLNLDIKEPGWRSRR